MTILNLRGPQISEILMYLCKILKYALSFDSTLILKAFIGFLKEYNWQMAKEISVRSPDTHLYSKGPGIMRIQETAVSAKYMFVLLRLVLIFLGSCRPNSFSWGGLCSVNIHVS